MNKLVNDVTEDAICREKVIVIAGYNRCICVFCNERMENRCYGITLPVKRGKAGTWHSGETSDDRNRK